MWAPGQPSGPQIALAKPVAGSVFALTTLGFSVLESMA
jgi:hypothetical protein